MKFCPKCKSLLIPNRGKLSCSCGYTKKDTVEFKEKISHKKIEIVDEDHELGSDTIPVVCWNCGNRGVYVKLNFFRGDEAPTRFYKCQKCKKVWRSSK